MRRKVAAVVDTVRDEKQVISFVDFVMDLTSKGGKTLRNVQIVIDYDKEYDYI